MSKHYLSLESFRKYGAIFQNINENEVLKNELAEYGYDDTALQAGKKLYDAAEAKLLQTKTESSEEKLAYSQFSEAFSELKEVYSKDRKKAKIIYKDNIEVKSALAIKGIAGTRYNQLLEDIEKFYQNLHTNEELRAPLARLKVTPTHIAEQIEKLKQVRSLYNTYLKEKGESQDATKEKDAAFAALEQWVKELYSIAKIALEDRPQLLESIAKFVRS